MSLSNSNDAPAGPKRTTVAPVKFVPVIVTEVPPVVGPALALTEVTVGAGVYVKWSLAEVALEPPTVVTVTSIVPAMCTGEVAVIVVMLTTVTDVAAVAPKLTPVAPVRFVPVIVTEVPPAVGPAFGLTDVTVGGAT